MSSFESEDDRTFIFVETQPSLFQNQKIRIILDYTAMISLGCIDHHGNTYIVIAIRNVFNVPLPVYQWHSGSHTVYSPTQL